MSNNMYGTITVSNIEKFANAILEVLQGKKYSFAAAYEYKNYRPELRTNQQLENGRNGSPLSIYYGENNAYAGFHFVDTYGVWGCSTSKQEEGYDPTFEAPYINIEYGKIEITQRTGTGMIAYWTIMIQD